VSLNYFGVEASQPLSIWRRRVWIHSEDPHGWFQWYGRYYTARRYLRKDGAMIWVRKTVGCVRKGDGSIDYFVSVIVDIPARKQAEKELRENEERFRSSLLHSPLPIVMFDDREQILAISQSWLEQNGYLREELPRLEDWTIRAYRERSGD
jgi:PAS domain-containing protein